MSGPKNDTAGLKVLVVEDEALIRMTLENTLEEIGCKVVGSAGKLEQALDLAMRKDADVAVLDVNLAGKESYPVAQTLTWRKVPFVFVTAYSQDSLKDNWQYKPHLQKPYSNRELKKALKEAVTQGAEER